jgi:hypothetical protein
MPVKQVTEWVRQSQLFLFFRREAEKAEARRLEARDWCKTYIMDHLDPDENGHRRLYFEEIRDLDGKKYTGLELRKSQPQPRLDDEAAKAFLESRNLVNLVRKPQTGYYWDWEELVILNQRGVISDDELDALYLTPEPTYSLYTLED